MNFRFKHISHRLLLQILFFLIYTFAAGSIFWLLSSHRNSTRKTVSLAMAMREEINHSYGTYTNFLLRSDTDQQFISQGENQFTRKFKEDVIQVSSSK